MPDRLIAVVVYPHAELLDIAGITTPLSLANVIGRPSDPYRVRVVSLGGGAIQCETGLLLQVDGPLEALADPVDTVIVAGGMGHEQAASCEPLLHHVRRLADGSRRVASVCTGTSVLAAAGLLDGRRATTHWFFAADIARRCPHVTIDAGPIYIRDGRVSTAAGVTSAIDLTLAFIEEDHGPGLARQVARQLVTYLQRPGNQAQMSMFTSARGVGDSSGDRIVQRAIDHITAHLSADLSTAAVAQHVGVSRRHLARLFAQHLGQSPARFIRLARLEAAARLLESTGLPMTRIAEQCGFSSAEALRQGFSERYAVSPSHYRARFAAQQPR